MMKKKLKNFDWSDLILVKLGMVAFAFFLITVPSPSRNVIMQWVHSVHWGWFLGAGIVLMLRPWKKMYM